MPKLSANETAYLRWVDTAGVYCIDDLKYTAGTNASLRAKGLIADNEQWPSRGAFAYLLTDAGQEAANEIRNNTKAADPVRVSINLVIEIDAGTWATDHNTTTRRAEIVNSVRVHAQRILSASHDIESAHGVVTWK